MGKELPHDEVALASVDMRPVRSRVKRIFSYSNACFRGEAMPSIASVSILTLLTAQEGAAHGTKLVAKVAKLRSGQRQPCRDQDHSGRPLYTPARLKYLKSQQAELSHIVDILNRLSLAHPEIAFTLINDGKEMTKTAGTGNLRQAIAGARMASRLPRKWWPLKIAIWILK